MKRAFSSEEWAPTLLLPLPFIDIKSSFLVPFPVFFLSSHGVKLLFNKIFDLDCWPLASDRSGEEVDLSFVGCQCTQVVKDNKAWQQELLNSKTLYMVEVIPLAAAIFWDPNFALCPKHGLNLLRKLEFKTKRLKAKVVNKRIGQI